MRPKFYLLNISVFLFFFASCSAEKRNLPVAIAPIIPSPAENKNTLPSSRMVNLGCETYVTTVWGDGPGQWGWPDGLEYRPSSLLPLKMDDAGRLYFADYINLRLLRYDQKNPSPIEISLKPFTSEVAWLFPFRFSIEIYQDEIFVPYGVDKIGVLSSDTDEPIRSIQLPGYHYDPYFPTYIAIAVDRQGRLYVFAAHEYSRESIFFNSGWMDNKWEKTQISKKMAEDMRAATNVHFWDNYAIGEVYSASTTTIILHQLNLEKQTSEFIDTGLLKKQTPALFGIDNNGNAYLIVSQTPPTWTYAKFNLQTHQMELAQMHLDTGYTIAVPSVSPEGILYILSYSDQDLSLQPGIYKCEFLDR